MRRLIGLGLGAALLASACVPGREALFDPVRASVRDRTGLDPMWQEGPERSPAADARIKELLAKPLTADSAAMIAVLASPRVQAAYEAVAEAGGAYGGGRTLRNPEIDAELHLPLDGEERFEISAMQDVTSLITLYGRARGGDARLRAARRQAVAATVELAGRARVAWVRVAAAERRRALRQLIAEAAAASASLAQGLHDAGNITTFQLTREQVFARESAVAVRSADADVASAREALNAVLGLTGDETGWTLAGTLAKVPANAPDVRQLEQDAVTASLDLDARRWTIEAAARDVGVARVESVVPELAVGVSAHEEADGWSLGPAVAIALPIFDQGQSRRAIAWSRLRRAQHEYTAVAVELRAEARRVGQVLVAAHTRALELARDVLPLRERLLDEAVRQYNAMNLSPFELLAIRREHIDAEERYIDALEAYWVAATEAEQLRAGAMTRRGDAARADGAPAANGPGGSDH